MNRSRISPIAGPLPALVAFGQLDDGMSLVLSAPCDHAAADVTTKGVTMRELVDNYGVVPPPPPVLA